MSLIIIFFSLPSCLNPPCGLSWQWGGIRLQSLIPISSCSCCSFSNSAGSWPWLFNCLWSAYLKMSPSGDRKNRCVSIFFLFNYFFTRPRSLILSKSFCNLSRIASTFHFSYDNIDLREKKVCWCTSFFHFVFAERLLWIALCTCILLENSHLGSCLFAD